MEAYALVSDVGCPTTYNTYVPKNVSIFVNFDKCFLIFWAAAISVSLTNYIYIYTYVPLSVNVPAQQDLQIERRLLFRVDATVLQSIQ